MNNGGKWASFCRCFLEGHFDISNGRLAAVIKMQRVAKLDRVRFYQELTHRNPTVLSSFLTPLIFSAQ